MSTDKENEKECSYGDRCYRKHPIHFEEYKHSHLNNFLKTLGNSGLDTIPSDFMPKVSRETVREQLNIVKKLLAGNTIPSTSLTLIKPQEKSVNNSRKRESTSGDGNESSVKKAQLQSTASKSSKDEKIRKKSGTSSTLSSKEHTKKMQDAKNFSEAMSFFQEVKKRSQGNICEKHKAAAPYYFFLTSVTDSVETHTEKLSLQLFDILDPSLGDLESSLQINFMVEFGWLMAHYHVANQRGKPLTLIYGEMDVETMSFPHITAVKVKPPSPFGSHHTKMCVMAYKDGSVRICVHTANLVESDWDNRVQGVWLSPLCPALPLGSDTASGESPTCFKHDLIQYLTSYKLPELQPWLGKLRRADFSKINVFFVASTPGSHKGVENILWGHPKLGRLLRQHVNIPAKKDSPPSKWEIIAQCSSIGSLGPKPSSWFGGEIKQSMSRDGGQHQLGAPPPIKLVYPTFDNVEGSYDNLLAGGCLPYCKKTHDKQTWLQEYLCEWKSNERHRTRAMPHIKTYTRVSPDLTRLAWFHLTSANMSKAAWGTQTKAGATNILSYEAGVLFIPKFVLGPTENTFPINRASDNSSPLFPMPYDLPLSPYTYEDVPWFIDNLT